MPNALLQSPEPLEPFRAILNAPKTYQPVSPYNLRLRRAMTAKIRQDLQSLPLPTANSPPAPDENAPLLNLDVHGNPLTYKSAKAGPDKAHWEKAEGDE